MDTVQAKVKYPSQRERRAEEEAKMSNILAVRDLYGRAHQLQQLQVILQVNALKKQEGMFWKVVRNPLDMKEERQFPADQVSGMGLEGLRMGI